MDTSLSRLLHGAVPLGSAARPLATLLPQPGEPPRVIEARVLAVTLMATADGKDTIAAGGNTAAGIVPRYQVQLEISGELLRGVAARLAVMTSMQLRPGQSIQLAVDSRAQLHLLNPTAARGTATPGVASSTVPAPSTAPAPAPAQSVELAQLRHWARILLPQQQPLHELAPVLQRWLSALSSSTAATDGAGYPDARALAQRWLAQLATPEQLGDPRTLRTLLMESGTFTESLWRQALVSGSAPPPPDQKSLLLQLLNLLQRPAHTRQAPQPPPGTEVRAQRDAMPEGRPSLSETGNPNSAPRDARPEPTAANEALLRQLNAALARTQLHQVDSLGTRQPQGGETQQTHTSWNFELPIRDGQHFSTMELHIQRRNAGRKDPRQMRWHVDLRLDLHQYGRFSAQLNLLGQQVSATLWAEQADTHLRVRQHLAALRLSLEAVGVTVRRLDCRCGLPPAAQPLFRRQLVDVRT